MHTPDDEMKPLNRNFWHGQRIRLRAIEQKDLDEILTSDEEPDTEIERYEDSIGFPLSREAQRESLQKLAKDVGKKDFLFCIIEDRQGQTVGWINSFDCVRRNGTFNLFSATP